jgi:hypothetical protein
MKKCKTNLALLWFIGSGILALLLQFQSIGQKYGNDVHIAWEWYITAIMPNLSLIGSALAGDLGNSRNNNYFINRTLYSITFGVSLFYFVSLYSIILIKPLLSISTIQLMLQSRIWLPAFQGVVAIFLGLFFVKAGPVSNVGAAKNL